MNINEVDADVLRPIFQARVMLAKTTEEEAIANAIIERTLVLDWIKSNSRAEKSFLWFCDYFDFEPSAVRRAIQEKRK